MFGYREYPSLIKGGHASYQLDCSGEKIESTEMFVNILITLNHHGLELNVKDLKEHGVIVHSTPHWKFSQQDQEILIAKKIKVIELPVDDVLSRMGAKPILGNVLIAAFIWASLGQDKEALKTLVGEKFAKKKPLLELNMKCIDAGFDQWAAASGQWTEGDTRPSLPSPDASWKDHLLLTGSHAMGLGAIHAGVRLYAGYPMTPSSPLLSFIADLQNQTGMVIKQAEDEITAAQIVSGAMLMGTRALTATSGGGFDLMSETVSLNGIIENPTVFVLAQRPGPATGLPTWTGQGDLLLAINTAHGEFTRCVISVSDSQDAFDVMPIAFNLAEEYQISVIVLTDKHIAEALFTQAPYNQEKAEIRRGIVTDPEQLKALKSSDRFDPHTPSGISQRWLPGTEAATWNAQGDEHSDDGSVDESAQNARLQMDKRMRKFQALTSALPAPSLFMANSGQRVPVTGEPELDLLLVGWGSTKGTVLDVFDSPELLGKNVGYLHYSYLWPLRTERFERLAGEAKKVVLIEQNYQGQLGMLLRQQCGVHIPERILKYDGRPFFYDELVESISHHLDPKKKKKASKTKVKDLPHSEMLGNEPNS